MRERDLGLSEPGQVQAGSRVRLAGLGRISGPSGLADLINLLGRV